MSGHTRVVRVLETDSQAGHRSTTFVHGSQLADTPRRHYERLHRQLWSACQEERRPGLFVFAVHATAGLSGRMWLSATDDVRAGTLGRHQFVDLSLTRDQALSLRHVLFVVRLVEGRVRFSAIDLETPGGLHTALGPQHVTQSEQPVLLRTAQLSFFCVPTGVQVMLPEQLEAAWRRFDEVPPTPQAGRWSWLKTASPAVGVLTLRLATGVFTTAIDEQLIRRGVLIGRDERCDVLIPDNYVSRVHAALLSVDGVAHLVDCGSSNGIHDLRRLQAVRCHRLEDADRFQVGNATLDWHLVQ
ncbi:MAG: FHA domain-containing protein [Archangiaceae bacterium]|nr:FHA domain-containing protein [Archangiaceae bacterium]